MKSSTSTRIWAKQCPLRGSNRENQQGSTMLRTQPRSSIKKEETVCLQAAGASSRPYTGMSMAMRAPGGRRRPSHGSAYSGPRGRVKRWLWQKAFLTSAKAKSMPKLRPVWRKSIKPSLWGVGAYVIKVPVSGSWCPWRHQRLLAFHECSPGRGLRRRTIRELMMRSGNCLRTFSASFPCKTLTALVWRMAFHSRRSDSSNSFFSFSDISFRETSSFLLASKVHRPSELIVNSSSPRQKLKKVPLHLWDENACCWGSHSSEAGVKSWSNFWDSSLHRLR